MTKVTHLVVVIALVLLGVVAQPVKRSAKRSDRLRQATVPIIGISDGLRVAGPAVGVHVIC